MLARVLEGLEEYKKITRAVKSGEYPVYVTGLSQIHKAHIISSLVEREGCPAIIISHDEASAAKIYEDIKSFFGEENEEKVALYPARELNLRGADGISREYEHARLKVLGRCLFGEIKAVVTSVEAALQYTIPPDVLEENTLILKSGDEIKIEELLKKLTGAGYTRAEQVEGTCQFACRGGIVDVFPPDSKWPVRIEFWGDEIDSINYFDLDTQRRTDFADEIEITPGREVLYGSLEGLAKVLKSKLEDNAVKSTAAAEGLKKDIDMLESTAEPDDTDKYLPLIYKEPCTIFNYLPQAVVFVSEYLRQKETLKAAERQFEEDLKLLFEDGVLFKGLERYSMEPFAYESELTCTNSIFMDNFMRSMNEIPLKQLININALQLAAWGGEYSYIEEELENYIGQGYCVGIFGGTEKSAKALAGDLREKGYDAALCADIKESIGGKVYVLTGGVSAGMEYPEAKFALISHVKTAVSKVRVKRKIKSGDEIKSLSDLTPGDYVVHVSHGVGIFEGIVKKDLHGVVKDYIKIRYAGSDALFVPVTQLDLVAKYIGPKEDKGVKLNKLNSAEWGKTRSRVKSAAKDMAKELIKLYGERQKAEGFAFSPDDEWQRDFEARFPYEETDDQLRCVEEIKGDMERGRPMDRLLCGDVGFGKTEVAIRAAFKCVMDSKQCAVLAPTTILAWQHYQTFLRRMEAFPVKVEMLSRFRTPKQQEKIISQLRRGEIDIIIGTHRLVQKDIAFKDLGLCIIDEEQRFGVAHKEKMKELKKSVDVLTLSATPIPRTLNMAMSGLRDMSVIEEAPRDRKPVQTYVIEHDWGVIAEAIKKELRRGGQAFYLHNRIDDIESCAAKIQRYIPDARIATAHGRMGEEAMSEVWRRLLDGEIDVLVCTTIIESGVDVPNCNTLIIENADTMGLSQLYQLRGRVGRSNRRAFAYFTFTRDKALSEIATKRLSAMRDFTSFGSGFKIAMRDLEIRGAGDILGASQHGHMEAVGYEMYMRLLSEAISEEKGEEQGHKNHECLIDMQIEAHIPERYIENLPARLDIYKKIAAIQNNEDALDVTDELIDRFGEPPASVKGLIDVALMRNKAAAIGIYEISQKAGEIFMYGDSFDIGKVGAFAAKERGRVKFNAGAKPYVSVRIASGESPIDAMRAALNALAS